MSEDSDADGDLAFIAGPDDAGMRLDQLLAASLDALSRSRCQALIKGGAVSIGGATILEPSHRVKSGDAISVVLPPPEDPVPKGEDIPLAILHEDADLIVIDKPAGMVVHPAPGSWSGTLVNALIHHAGTSLSGIGGVRRPGIVHRLDKDTSGVMVIAKTDLAMAGLAAQFADHGRTGPLERDYLALAWGTPPRPSGVIKAPLGRAPFNRLKQAVLRNGGREAITHYRLVETFGSGAGAVSLLRLKLETGRTHQIRVHLAHIGQPVLGDPLYGAGYASKAKLLAPTAQAALAALNRQALHAARLAFRHPASGEILAFETPPPPDMAALIAALKP